MRWFWIDRFTEFVSGRRAKAIKNVSLVEDHIDLYVPGNTMMAASLIVEGLAQTGGLLVGQLSDFRQRVVLAKVSSAKFHELVQPGDRLTYTASIESIQSSGAFVSGTSHLGDKLQAEIDLFFAQLDDRFTGIELFEPANFLRMLRLWKLFDVAQNEDGTPIRIPIHLLEAERCANESELKRLLAAEHRGG